MRSEHEFNEALQEMADYAEQPGRLGPVADIRRRGDALRRRRHVIAAGLGVIAIGAIGVGVVASQASLTVQPPPVGPAGSTASSLTGTPTAAPSSATTVSPSVAPPPGALPGDDPLLAGDRQVAIVRVDAFESGVSLLDEGPLGEVDGDEGRRLFVIEPQGPDTYRVRAAQANSDGSDACWQAQSPGGDPLTVVAAVCSPTEPRQQFTILVGDTSAGGSQYAIGNAGAYLQYSNVHGLILEEPDGVPLTTYFRFVDNGAAPT
ncbi:hypothetical protein [Micromonospora sp. LOL_023]|uniref:hypothetical protein n=1 Tax=Micromonospora sp. LOL_023 TaxID=3345418 RepID=UPI003A8A561A